MSSGECAVNPPHLGALERRWGRAAVVVRMYGQFIEIIVQVS